LQNRFITHLLITSLLFPRYYTIVAPKAIRPNSEYHVSVSSNGLSEAVAVRLTIEGTDSAGSLLTQEQEVSVEPGTTKNAEFKV
jgi:CD109 antigen